MKSKFPQSLHTKPVALILHQSKREGRVATRKPLLRKFLIKSRLEFTKWHLEDYTVKCFSTASPERLVSTKGKKNAAESENISSVYCNFSIGRKEIPFSADHDV